jgi:hypothetical protein
MRSNDPTPTLFLRGTIALKNQEEQHLVLAEEIGRRLCNYREILPSLLEAKMRRPPIANSDAGWSSYTHEAIDQAWRAVRELGST